jgi:outer membrane protein OmpA-like peptidoglycan-associated protein
VLIVGTLAQSCVPRALRKSIKELENAQAQIKDQTKVVQTYGKTNKALLGQLNTKEDPTSLTKEKGAAEAAILDKELEKIQKEQEKIMSIVTDNSRKISILVTQLKKTPVILNGGKRKKLIQEIVGLLQNTKKGMDSYSRKNVPKRLRAANKAIAIIKINADNNSDEVVPLKFVFDSGSSTPKRNSTQEIRNFINEIDYKVKLIEKKYPGQNITVIIKATGYSDTYPFQTYRNPYLKLCREARNLGRRCGQREISLYLSEKRARSIGALINFKRKNVEVNIKTEGRGMEKPYPKRKYKPHLSDDDARKICKLSAYVEIYPYK